MLDTMVAVNAAEFLQWNYSANRAINHFEWTNRKIDMSAGGGANSGGWAGDELRRRVAARMTGTGEPEPEPQPTTLRKKDDAVPIFMQATEGEGGRLYMLTPGRPKQWLDGPSWALWARLYPEWSELPGSPFLEVEIDTVNGQYQPSA